METTTERNMYRQKIEERHAAILARQEDAALREEQVVKPAAQALNAAEQRVKDAEAAKLIIADATRKVLQNDFSKPHEVTQARQQYAEAVNAVTAAKKRADEVRENFRLVNTINQGRMYADHQTERSNLFTDVFSGEWEEPEVAAALSRIGRLYAVRKEIFLTGHHPVTLVDFLGELAGKIPQTMTGDEVLEEWLADEPSKRTKKK